MPFLSDLQSICHQTENAELVAKTYILTHIESAIRKADFHYSDNGDEKIYTFAAKIKLIIQFREEEKSIEELEKNEMLGDIKRIALFFRIQYFTAFTKNKIDVRKIGEEEKKSSKNEPKLILPESKMAIDFLPISETEKKSLEKKDCIYNSRWYYDYEKCWANNKNQPTALILTTTDSDPKGGFKGLVAYLHKHPQITSLQIKNLKIDDNDAKTLSYLGTIKKLVLQQNELSSIGAIALATNKIFNMVEIKDNPIMIAGVVAFAVNSSITSLTIHGSGMDEMARYTPYSCVKHPAIEALTQNIYLTYLDLSYHPKLLAVDSAALLRMRNLKTLVLNNSASFSSITATMLERNTMLTHLSIQHSRINFFNTLALAASNLNGLEFLDVNYNGFTHQGKVLIAKTLKQKYFAQRAKLLLDETPVSAEVACLIQDYAGLTLPVNEAKKTPYHQLLKAIRNCESDIVTVLLEHSASIYELNEEGVSPLVFAAQEYLEGKSQYLEAMLTQDKILFFDIFKKFYYENPGFSFFSTNMRSLIEQNKIKDIVDVITYLRKKSAEGDDNTKSHQAFYRLIEILSRPHLSREKILKL